MAVAELPRELVVAIARAAKHGVTLATMLQVCRAWRVALTAEIASLWREAALAQYPRLHGILAAAEAQSPCFRTLYRSQLEADDKARIGANYPPDPELDQYVVTAELSWAAEWGWSIPPPSDYPGAGDHQRTRVRGGWTAVARNSIRLDRALAQLQGPDGSAMLMLTKEAAYDALIPSTATCAEISDRVRVTIHVTRVSDMKSMQLADTPDVMNRTHLMGGFDQEIRFATWALPRRPQIFYDTGSNFESQPTVEVAFTPQTMEVTLHFIEQPHHTQGEVAEPLMTISELKRYLAWQAEW